ncbi:helix-turn-helix domain-containing protein [Streptomyces bluensis]|uniref:helix-turn-helix domain-containing protein n=1 Tax=Streptomyces bluensis TaxID=33897 RepID=UPI0016731838|nr:helix-turn-helix transcriptional regulator [Streptomyces bluensis]GGZ89284.1 transcriptional regulator [Streptomyces bluensis]
MPPRTAPTVRQLRLGTELRRMREQSGLSINEAASALGVSRTHITNVELARFGVSEQRMRTLAAIYRTPDLTYVDALVAMAQERRSGWWEEYRGLLPTASLDLAELEYHATSLRVFCAMHVPGLLQTEEYARAVLGETVPSWPDTELRRRLSLRMKRRDILDRDDPPSCTFIIHEAALRLEFGGPDVMRAQLKRLAESSRRRNITVRVIPFSAGGFPLPGLTVEYASGPVPQLDTVQMDTANSTEFLDAHTQLSNYRVLLERITKAALPLKESREFIRSVAERN